MDLDKVLGMADVLERLAERCERGEQRRKLLRDVDAILGVDLGPDVPPPFFLPRARRQLARGDLKAACRNLRAAAVRLRRVIRKP